MCENVLKLGNNLFYLISRANIEMSTIDVFNVFIKVFKLYRLNCIIKIKSYKIYLPNQNMISIKNNLNNFWPCKEFSKLSSQYKV